MVTQLADLATDAVPVLTNDARLGGGVPVGVIVMWSGTLASIPSGWVLCDGQNNTPDLRDRFIRGAAAGQNPGATGGSATHTHADHATHTHTYTQVPNHVHVQTVNSAATGGLSGYGMDTSTNNGVASGYSTQNPTGGVAQGTTNANAAQAHDSPSHLPPFFSLAYLMKT